MVFVWAAMAAQAAVPSNTMWIYHADGAAGERPVTLSRFFAQGEIPDYPHAVVEGTPVETQSDVKTRWPDGSVQHALISFVASIPRGRTAEVFFVNQESGNNEGHLTQSGMLEFNGGNWDARIHARAGGAGYTVDAKQMLAEGHFRYWMRGPVVTQVIVEGKSGAPGGPFSRDFGWRCKTGCEQPYDAAAWEDSGEEQHKSLHPIFVLTFYNGHPGVKVEYIVENMWATKLQDQRYDVELFNGAAGDPVYQRRNLVHIAKTRWRKVFWSGQAPRGWRDESAPGLVVNLNLPYLVYSRAIPNYDTRIRLSQSGRNGEWQEFRQRRGGEETQFCTNRTHCGQWLRYFGTGGGRGEIGLLPRWYVKYLYTFDDEMYELMIQNALVSGVIPIHVRESAEERLFLPGTEIPAQGRPLSLYARPTVRTMRFVDQTKEEDLFVPVGTVSCLDTLDFACTEKSPGGAWTAATVNNWKADLAHQASFAYIPYLVTGDWYFLEEMYFWASYLVAMGNPPNNCDTYCRNGDWGYILWYESVRAEAWGLRNLAHAALLAPLGSPERVYYRRMLDNNLAVREGKFDIRDGAFFEPNPGGTAEDPCPAGAYSPDTATRWCWGRMTVQQNMSNPLLFLTKGVNAFPGVDDKKALSTDSIWQHNYHRVVYGHLAELGFPIQRLHEETAKRLISQLRDSSYNPFLAYEYMYAVRRRSDGQYMRTWAEVKDAYIQSTRLTSAMNGNQMTFEISDVFNANNSQMRLDMGQTVQIEDEQIRICNAGHIVAAGKYLGSRITVCPGGRGVNGTRASAHAEGAEVRRLFSEIPTVYATYPDHGYAFILRAAMSFGAQFSTLDSDGTTELTGQSAWDWVEGQMAPYLKYLAENPQWAIVPRDDERLAVIKTKYDAKAALAASLRKRPARGKSQGGQNRNEPLRNASVRR